MSFFEAISIFTLSILVSTIIYRARYSVNMSVYNIFMAEALSLVGSTVMVMVAASICQHLSGRDDKDRQKHAPATPKFEKNMKLKQFRTRANVLERSELRSKHIYIFVLNTLLTIVLFTVEFAIQSTNPDTGLAAERRCLKAVPGHTDLGKHVSIPVCFSFWLVALVGSLPQLLGLLYPEKFSQRWGKTPILKALAFIPMIFGTAALVWLVYIFCRMWRDMRMAFGQAFVDGEQDWTFGQCMAVFTWCSPLLAVVQGVIRHFSKDK